jgi:curved DNA-binding protein CbpA
MSSSVSGKFQDHYVLLGVDPKADSATIQAAYAKLADKYRPGNPETGDPEKFESINLAFEVLSDANLRAGFDKLKGVGQEEGKPQFSGLAFFDALKAGVDLRAAVLCILYDRRRTNPTKPSLSSRHLESMLRATKDELEFALWYLKQRLLVINDDKSSLQITVEGLDYLEQDPPTADRVIPVMKPDAVQGKQIERRRSSGEVASGRESVVAALNRAQTRQASAASQAALNQDPAGRV